MSGKIGFLFAVLMITLTTVVVNCGGGGGGTDSPTASPSTTCQDISGSWNVNETVTITCSGSFGSGTQTQSGSGSVTITQNGCDISFMSPANAMRTGTVADYDINFSGIIAQSTQGVDFDQNYINFTGTVNQDLKTINTAGTGEVTGSVSGAPGSCTASSTETFSR
jgi:hypothetical protein